MRKAGCFLSLVVLVLMVFMFTVASVAGWAVGASIPKQCADVEQTLSVIEDMEEDLEILERFVTTHRQELLEQKAKLQGLRGK